MNKEKFNVMLTGLTSLIEDYRACKNELAKLQLEELIVAYAENFVKIYRSEAIATKKKSEMARNNCKREETSDNPDFQAVFETVKKTLADWNGDEEFINTLAQLIFDRNKKGLLK